MTVTVYFREAMTLDECTAWMCDRYSIPQFHGYSCMIRLEGWPGRYVGWVYL
jgi:hypothetical protein